MYGSVLYEMSRKGKSSVIVAPGKGVAKALITRRQVDLFVVMNCSDG